MFLRILFYHKFIFNIKKIFLFISDEKFYELFCLMHSLFPPTQKKSYKTDRKKFYKPSICQSISGFVEIVDNAEDIKDRLLQLEAEYLKVGLSIQPKIFKILNYEDGKYAVTYNEYYFGFNDILLATDCCFKMFFVFNLEYQFESQRFWKFIANFFFNIKVNDTEISLVTKEFRNFLKFGEI